MCVCVFFFFIILFGFFALLQRQNRLVHGLIQILFSAHATVSAVRHFIDKLTLPLQQLHRKNKLGFSILQEMLFYTEHAHEKICC